MMCFELQVARQTLIERNRLLCAKHAAIGEQIAALARLDLVKQRTSWFAGVERVRRVFVRAEGDFPRDLQVPCCNHTKTQHAHESHSTLIRRVVMSCSGCGLCSH
jgi:hypothetical protein